MRILISTFTFAPQANGVAVAATEQAFGLASRGHEVAVATSVDESRGRSAAPVNPRVFEFRVQMGRPPRFAMGEDIKRYQDFVRTFAADAIIFHCWQSWPTDLAMSVISDNPAKKILVSHGFNAHKWPRVRKFPWGLWQWTRSLFYVFLAFKRAKVFDRVVFLSNRMNRDRFFDRWALNWLGRPPCAVIPNGTHLQNFRLPPFDFRKRYELDNKFMAICVGLFDPCKDQAATLRAFMRANLPNSVLVLIGNEFNAYVDELRQIRERMSMSFPNPAVLFLEKLERKEITAAYCSTDLVLLSSRGETQPLVLLDAMAAGKPFVSTDVGCVSEFPGGLVATGEKSFQEKIELLYHDQELRRTLSEAGILACQKVYSWDAVLDAYEELLFRLHGGKK